MEPIGLKNKKKMRNVLFVVFFILIMLVIRIGYLQFFKGKELQTLAYEQQVQERAINAKRGTIYDATGKYVLAVSSTAYTVSVNPTNIMQENKEKLPKIEEEIKILIIDFDKEFKKSKKEKFY